MSLTLSLVLLVLLYSLLLPITLQFENPALVEGVIEGQAAEVDLECDCLIGFETNFMGISACE